MNHLFTFEENFRFLQQDIHKNAVEHGWWEDARNDGELIAHALRVVGSS